VSGAAGGLRLLANMALVPGPHAPYIAVGLNADCIVLRGGAGGKLFELFKYPKGSPPWVIMGRLSVAPLWEDGEGEVAIVEVGDTFLRLLDPASELDELASDSMEASLSELGPKVDNGSEPRRRRPLGEGKSPGLEESGGPRRKLATAREAKSYLRNSASSSLRRFPLLLADPVAEARAFLPLLLVEGMSLRLVNEPPC
jgi:hypothetical protein